MANFFSRLTFKSREGDLVEAYPQDLHRVLYTAEDFWRVGAGLTWSSYDARVCMRVWRGKTSSSSSHVDVVKFLPVFRDGPAGKVVTMTF